MGQLISVLIPAYNHECYIEEAIRSVIDQTYQKIELIIIDDGSSDATWDKITELKAECEKRFLRVILERQENRGTAATFRKLLAKAQGEYVFILASDDFVFPGTLDTLHKFLSTHLNYSLVVGDNRFVDEKSTEIYWDHKRRTVLSAREALFKTFGEFLQRMRPEIDFSSAEFGSYSSLLLENYIPNGYLIRKIYLDQVDSFNEKAPLEDWYLMLQLAKISKLKYLDQVLFSYRWHDTNSIKQREKMLDFAQKTFQYEMKNILAGTNEKYKKQIFQVAQLHEKRNCRSRLRVRGIFHLYKIKKNFYSNERWGLCLLGKEII